MSDLKDNFQARFGFHRVSELPVKEGEIPLLMMNLELRTPVTVLMTNGLSNYRMPVPAKLEGEEHNELYFCLPSYWELEDTSNPQMNWVFDWIQRLAKYVIEKETWFGHGHTMPCGSDLKMLSNTMKQNHFFLMHPILLKNELEKVQVGDKNINFLAVVPIFIKEFEFKQSRGTFKFIRKLINKGVSEKLDDFRDSVTKSKWRFKS
jgi:hypothetical protein